MLISILGAGGWGTALSIVLHNNGHEVALWEYKKSYARGLKRSRENKVFLPGIKIPKEIEITNSLEDAVKNKNLIVIAVPTQFIRGVLKNVKQYKFGNAIFVSVSKGIEHGTLMTVSQIINDELGIPKQNIGVLSGPSHAEEVAKKIPTAVTVASINADTAELIQNAFSNSFLRVYSSTDMVGVELGGALKNIIAIGAGIVDGAKFGDNTKAAIMTRGIKEISRLGIAMGAKPDTFSGLSGIGDVIVTCMSRHSRNRYVGEEIGKGKKLKALLKSMDMVAEGVESTKSVYELAKKLEIEVPITNAVYDILYNEKDPKLATFELMTRDSKEEQE